MSTITLTLPDDKMARLADEARERGVAVEELLEQAATDLADRRVAFDSAATYVLRKNAELYRRLAK